MQPGRNRRAKRMPIHWPTTLAQGDTRRACTIEDLSRSGARVRLTAAVAVGDRVRLVDDRIGTIDAIVMWCRNDLAGIEFVTPEPEVVARLRTVLDALEEAEARRAAAAAGPRRPFGRRTHFGTPRKP